MFRMILVVAALISGSSIAMAQDDVIRLKNGRFVVGKITTTDDSGVIIEKLDGTGTLQIAWNLIPESHHARFRETAEEASEAEVPTIDGVRVVTSFRVVEGLLVLEDKEARLIKVKTKNSRSPVSIPMDVVLVKEAIKLTESQVYTAAERVERRLADETVDQTDPVQVEEIARFANSIGEIDQALSLFEQAKALIEASVTDVENSTTMSDDEKDEALAKIESQLEAYDLQISEIQAARDLREIEELAASGKFDEAIPRAEEWGTTYEGTPLWEKNQDLVDRLMSEQEEFIANRSKVLARKVVDAMPKAISKLIRKAAKQKTVDEGVKGIEKVDEEVIGVLAKQFEASEEEIREWWDNAIEEREKKKHRAKMGTGTWIVNGGQDGGFDHNQGPPRNNRGNRNNRNNQGGRNNRGGGGSMDDLRRRYGGGGGGGGGNNNNNQGGGPTYTKDLRRKIQGKDDWWKSQTVSTREDFLEANWAKGSGLVTSDGGAEKDCPQCGGDGTLKASRYGSYVDVTCPRCHKAQKEFTITWW